jgi:hypothetical protein
MMPELGSKISLISKADIRYEGRLFTVDPQECTIALANGECKCNYERCDKCCGRKPQKQSQKLLLHSVPQLLSLEFSEY